MFRLHSTAVRCIVAGCVLSAPMLADFSYQETSQITGGALFGVMKLAGTFSRSGHKPTDPIIGTVAIKGNRMVRRSDEVVIVTDLDKQTITTIHVPKHSYSVMTFAQLKEQMEKMSQQMQSKNSSQNTSVDVKVNDTGQTKTIAGAQAHEVILTISVNATDPQTGNSGTMTVVDDAWTSADVPGYNEASDFYKRMADAMGFAVGSNAMLNRPDIAKAMAQVYSDGSKLRGMPVESTIRMGGVGQPTPAAGNQTQAASDQKPSSSTDSAAPTSVGSALAGAFGSRFGRHKKQDDGGNGTSNSSGDPSALIEMTLRATNYNSNPVDETLFAIPDGYKQVQEDLGGGRHR